jgi:cysteinyl-tRNA synthetase
MAGSVAPGTLDIHSGGIDLAFPHHDNEIAQSEAQYDCNQWVNYFLHMGHLHIEGQKMSKSLKNFITVDEALQKYSSRQMRLLFLSHSWNSTLDYKESSMKEVLSYERLMTNFVEEVQALILEHRRFLENDSKGVHYHHEQERILAEKLAKACKAVHLALLDSFNTPSVLDHLKGLVVDTRQYLQSVVGRPLSALLLKDVLDFVVRIFKVFGVSFSVTKTETQGNEEFSKAVQLASSIRDRLRHLAKEKLKEEKTGKNNIYDISEGVEAISISANGDRQLWKDVLGWCDGLRTEFLNLGILLEDREMNVPLAALFSDTGCITGALVKQVDKEYLGKMEGKKKEDSSIAALRDQKKKEKEERAKIDPARMFLDMTDKYSKFDETGVPTHDAAGVELSKNLRKKLGKEYEAQVKIYSQV